MKCAAISKKEILDSIQNLALAARLHMTANLFHGEAIHGTVEDCDNTISHWLSNPDDTSHEDMTLMFGAYFGSILVGDFNMIWQESDFPDDAMRFFVSHPPTRINVFPFSVAQDVISSSGSSFKSALSTLAKEIHEAQQAAT